MDNDQRFPVSPEQFKAAFSGAVQVSELGMEDGSFSTVALVELDNGFVAQAQHVTSPDESSTSEQREIYAGRLLHIKVAELLQFREADRLRREGGASGHTELGDTRAEDVHTTPNISLGRIVRYRLTEQDASEINRRRIQQHEITTATSVDWWHRGAQAHVGNRAWSGQVLPAIAVAVWGPKCANLQVFLDGNDTLWKTSVSEQPEGFEGTVTGFWHWPART
ncbi:MAG: hypothetical protein ACREO0_08830 [Pseudoxanthomonas sp.]